MSGSGGVARDERLFIAWRAALPSVSRAPPFPAQPRADKPGASLRAPQQ